MTFRTIYLLRPERADSLRSLMLSVDSHTLHVVGETVQAYNIDAMCLQLSPDLIFYDPTMDDGAYLQQRREASQDGPLMVCYTADVRFAVDAFEAGVVHYLLPTADATMLENTLHRAERRNQMRVHRLGYGDRQQNSSLMIHEPHPSMAQVRHPSMAQVIALPLQNGLDIRPCEQIVHVHGEGSYARVVFQRDPSVIVSRSIGDCEETLQDRGFLRVHRSHLVNLMHVRRILRGKQQRLCMSNGDEVEVSERHRETLMEHLHVIGRRRR